MNPDPFEYNPTPEQQKKNYIEQMERLVREGILIRKKRHKGHEDDEPTYVVRTIHRQNPKTGRNVTCECGSGKKFKHCCMKKTK